MSCALVSPSVPSPSAWFRTAPSAATTNSIATRTRRPTCSRFRRATEPNRTEYLGDILISVETARRSAARFRLALQDEIKILSLHGVLHLMGYDHETDRGRMARAERRWSDRLHLRTSLSARAATRTARTRGGKE